jgi:CCR4-NOT transcription complex subunit 7/8
MKIWFPSTYDVKHLLKWAIKAQTLGAFQPNDPGAADILTKFEQKSGLEALAESFKIKRLGAAHQAGSDSLLTGKIFFQLKDKIFGGAIPDEHIGKTWGLSVGGTMTIPYTGGAGIGGHNDKEDTPTSAINGKVNGPSTPSTSTINLVTTPAAAQSHNTNGNGISVAPMTPGGGGGVLGQFFSGAR